MPDPAIFISYRIADAQVEARLLFTDLANHFGEQAAFLDKKRLEAGMDWPDELTGNVQKAQVLLVLIREKGKWLGTNDEGIRRTDDPKDWVRLEIEHAFAAGKIIIPVLFNGASLPSAAALPKSMRFLLEKQCCKITAEKWDADVAAFFVDLEKIVPCTKPDVANPLVHPLSEYPLPADIPDPLEHHPAPFLGLPFFSRTAARLFFGRTLEILKFFSFIENPDIRIIRLFGHSGIGKSSLLEAGILPRLEAKWQPKCERRKITEGLGRQLDRMRRESKISGKLPVYILDQVEEIFTDLLPGEQADFVEQLRRTVQEEKDATIVLGFRSDFQLDLSKLLNLVDCIQEDLAVLPLNHFALVESVEGVWRDPNLSKRYSIKLEEGFADFVVRDLLHTESGGITTILQNRLLRLYDQAKKSKTAADPLIYLCIADYEAFSRSASAEEELLDFQIQRLHETISKERAEEKDILETLNRFVLDKPTAGALAKNALPDDPKNLRDALRQVNLLTELTDNQAIRLSHDVLAPIVRRRYNQFLSTENNRLVVENFALFLRQILTHLPDLFFVEAFQSLSKAYTLSVRPEDLAPFAFELAYVFLNARKTEYGSESLRMYFECQMRSGKNLPGFSSQADVSFLLDLLHRYDPALFVRLQRRYFPTMISIEGGTFDMGDVLGDQEQGDEKIHPVTLSGFEIADTPITWQQYGLYCLAEDQKLPIDNDFGRGERPVINISWEDAVAYGEWLSQRTNKKYRLPTEAEWEYVARQRGEPVRFGNGQNIAKPDAMNFDAREAKKDYSVVGEYRRKTTPVRRFSPNKLGVFDMSGNVLEWCYDWHAAYLEESQTNPIGAANGSYHIYRGGSWQYDARYCRAACRYYNAPGYKSSSLGFRVAISCM